MSRLHFHSDLHRQLLQYAACLWLACLPWLAEASQWLTIQKTDQQQLMVDKQSLLEEKPYTKAWIKVEYRLPQRNVESVDRVYHHAKALWYFDCNKRKAATLQVFQYEENELVYSAGTTTKQADFIEPLPESEVDVAQQYVCKWQQKQALAADAASRRASASPLMPAVAGGKPAGQPGDPTLSDTPAAASPGKTDQATAGNASAAGRKPAPATPTGKPTENKVASAPAQSAPKPPATPADKATLPAPTASDKNTRWSYQGETGPAHWQSLQPDYALCGLGQQQSPIDITQSISAALKPIQRLQKFPLKSIRREAHGLVMDAGTGNMMVLDQKPYQLKSISLHSPAEHQIRQKTYAAELQMLHEDKSGHRVILAVLLEEGSSHPTFDKLIHSLPKAGDDSKPLALRVTPAELMPAKPGYYRYSGSLTTPPCSEGVQWLVMKETLKISKAQLEMLRQALGEDNQRPLQDAQGRMVLE
ncbi:MAG TPA: surface-adhesin E family protein [Methylophilus sp.]